MDIKTIKIISIIINIILMIILIGITGFYAYQTWKLNEMTYSSISPYISVEEIKYTISNYGFEGYELKIKNKGNSPAEIKEIIIYNVGNNTEREKYSGGEFIFPNEEKIIGRFPWEKSTFKEGVYLFETTIKYTNMRDSSGKEYSTKTSFMFLGKDLKKLNLGEEYSLYKWEENLE